MHISDNFNPWFPADINNATLMLHCTAEKPRILLIPFNSEQRAQDIPAYIAFKNFLAAFVDQAGIFANGV